MATFKAVVFQGGRHLKKDGTTNVKIRIYHNGNSQYLSTEYFIRPEFLGDDGLISSYSDESEALNYEITELVQNYRRIYIKLGSTRTLKMTCTQLKEEIQKESRPNAEYIDFVAFAREEISKTVKRKTAAWYSSALVSFIKFYGTERIDANEIRSKTLEEFITFLAQKNVQRTSGSHLMEPGTINNYLRALRVLYNRMKKKYNNEDYDIIRVPNSPFLKIKIPQYIRKRKNLGVEDIICIRDAHFERERTKMARDVFMMLFYMMGMNMYDFFSVAARVGGRVEYERSKVTTIDNKRRIPLSVKVEPELKPLLDYYSNGTFLSHFRMQYTDYNNFLKAVNKELKVIAKQLGLEIPLSTNWARHSWASIARNKAGVAKADVDFCLGHVNNDYKMADIYIDVDYGVCDRANRAVLDLLQNKE